MRSGIQEILYLTCLSTCLETFLQFLLFLELIYYTQLILQNRVCQQFFRNCKSVFKHLFLSTGKLFFINSFSKMLLYMSITFPQNFIFFRTVLLFLIDFRTFLQNFIIFGVDLLFLIDFTKPDT